MALSTLRNSPMRNNPLTTCLSWVAKKVTNGPELTVAMAGLTQASFEEARVIGFVGVLCGSAALWLSQRQKTQDTNHRSFEQALSQYTLSTADGVVCLTEEGQKVLKAKFSQVVSVSEDAWIQSEGGLQEGFSLPLLPEGVHHRKFDLSRLPNFLLFGSDTLGPDLTDAFADLIDWGQSRPLYHQKIQMSPKARPSRKNRNMRQDHEAARRFGLRFEQTTYIGSRFKYIPPPERKKGLTGTVEVFYDSKKIPSPIPDSILRDLYPIPQQDSVIKIQIIWPIPLRARS